jgi:hypothetical protein
MEKETSSTMKIASILLALVVGLGFVREAGAAYSIESDYSLILGHHRFGFIGYIGHADLIDSKTHVTNVSHEVNYITFIYLGPFGKHEVPFTATQGLVGFCCILATLIIVPAVLTVRWRRRATR